MPIFGLLFYGVSALAASATVKAGAGALIAAKAYRSSRDAEFFKEVAETGMGHGSKKDSMYPARVCDVIDRSIDEKFQGVITDEGTWLLKKSEWREMAFLLDPSAEESMDFEDICERLRDLEAISQRRKKSSIFNK